MHPLFPTLPLKNNKILRQISPTADAQAYFTYINHLDVACFVPTNCLPTSKEKAQNDLQFLHDLLQKKRGIYWAIAEQENNTLIGTCGFETWYRTHARLEMVYDLDPAFWGQGIMHDALLKIINFAFVNMPINRIEAITTTDNLRSQHVLDKCQFTQEALLKQYRYFKHNFTDILIYALLRQNCTFLDPSNENTALKSYFYAL